MQPFLSELTHEKPTPKGQANPIEPPESQKLPQPLVIPEASGEWYPEPLTAQYLLMKHLMFQVLITPQAMAQ